MTDSSLILVPASCRDSEEIITPHPPGETKVIIKTVQSLSYSFFPMIEVFYRWIMILVSVILFGQFIVGPWMFACRAYFRCLGAFVYVAAVPAFPLYRGVPFKDPV
ncbi:hypothetical protein MNBD_NITROSPIRAE02-50, partial [hydrothermal vent metagenome]